MLVDAESWGLSVADAEMNNKTEMGSRGRKSSGRVWHLALKLGLRGSLKQRENQNEDETAGPPETPVA